MSSKLLTAAIGDYETLCRAATAKDIEEAQRFVSLHRRCEYLAWRALLYTELGRQVEIGYSADGAPHIIGEPNIHIGVSHCRDRVAVIIGNEPCSVDIERRDRNFRRVAPKFINADEQFVYDAGKDALGIAWSAKECAYKYATDEVALSDIHIRKIDYATGIVEYDICGESFTTMRFVVEKEHIIVTLG